MVDERTNLTTQVMEDVWQNFPGIVYGHHPRNVRPRAPRSGSPSCCNVRSRAPKPISLTKEILGMSAVLGKGSRRSSRTPPGSEGEKLLELPPDRIDPNPEQPRQRIDPEKLSELAKSMIEQGVVQPLVVRRVGSRYQIIAGERRWRAAREAGLAKVPVIVRQAGDRELLEIALVENIQREELNPMEEAGAYRRLIAELGYSQEQVAARVGKDRSTVANLLRLLRLPRNSRPAADQKPSRVMPSAPRSTLPTRKVAIAREIVERA
jgi:ParB family chromosome partitioning protein